MKLEEILTKDTKGKGLSEFIKMLGSVEDADAVYALRKRHEEDTGIPMEEDDFGKGEVEIVELMLPELSEKVSAVEKGNVAK